MFRFYDSGTERSVGAGLGENCLRECGLFVKVRAMQWKDLAKESGGDCF